MKIQIVAIGNKLEVWLDKGIDFYLSRLTKWKIDIDVLSSKNLKSIDEIKVKETQILLNKVKYKNIIFIDKSGKKFNSEEMAIDMEKLSSKGGISLLIGGAFGFAEDISKKYEKWSLSDLTYPHGIVRLIILEQLYRTSAILNHHPCHK